MLLLHLLLLQSLRKMVKSDPGMVRPEVGLNTRLIHQVHALVHEEEQLVMFYPEKNN